MARLWVLVVVLLLAVGCCRSDGAARAPTADSISYGRSATVALVNFRKDHYPRTFCSGVWVGESTILTAAHCVSDQGVGGLVNFAQYGDSDWGPGHEARIVETHGGTVTKLDEGVDLALIRGVTWRPHVSVSLASVIVEGETVLIVGHPVGLLWNQTPGYVNAVRWMTGADDSKVEQIVQIAGASFFGNSGGPALNANGELVGICSFMVTGSTMNFFVSSYEVKRFLAGVL